MIIKFQIAYNETLDKMWHNWDLENGYRTSIYAAEVQNYGTSSHRRRRATVDATAKDWSDEELPRRGIAPGKSMGLSVMLNVKEDEYYCSGTESVGFKTLLHMPMTMPELLEYGFGVHPGKETFVSVRPEMIEADEDIHRYDYHKRQCFLDSDRSLMFFKNYTFLNCFQECAANYTKEVNLKILAWFCKIMAMKLVISALWMCCFLHAKRSRYYPHLLT